MRGISRSKPVSVAGFGLVLGILVGACSPGPTPAPTRTPSPTALAVDPCSLLSATDLTTALSRPATTGTRTTEGIASSCTWEMAPAIIVVTVVPFDPTAFASGLAQGGSVDGLGNQAYFAGVTHDLHFAQGDADVQITVSGVSSLDAESDELSLAAAVQGHL